MHLIVSVHTAANWRGSLQNECTVRRLWRRPNQPLSRWAPLKTLRLPMILLLSPILVVQIWFQVHCQVSPKRHLTSWCLWQNPQMLCLIMSNEDTNSSCDLPSICFACSAVPLQYDVNSAACLRRLFNVWRRQTGKNKIRLGSEDQWRRTRAAIQRGTGAVWIIVIVWDARFVTIILGFLFHVT